MLTRSHSPRGLLFNISLFQHCLKAGGGYFLFFSPLIESCGYSGYGITHSSYGTILVGWVGGWGGSNGCVEEEPRILVYFRLYDTFPLPTKRLIIVGRFSWNPFGSSRIHLGSSWVILGPILRE